MMLPTQAVRPLADQIAILNAARRTLVDAHDALARAVNAPTINTHAPSDSMAAQGGHVATAIAQAHREAASAAEMLARLVAPLAPAVDAAIGGGT